MPIAQIDNVFLGNPHGIKGFSQASTVVDSSGFSTTFPASNLLLPIPTDRAQTENTTGTVSFTLDYGSSFTPSAISYASLMFSNASSAATWRYVRATALPALSNIAYDSGTVSFWASAGIDHVRLGRRHSYHRVTDVNAYRYEHIEFTDASNAEGFYRFGRFHSGEGFQPDNGGIQYGSEAAKFVDPSIRTMTPGGNSVIRAKRGGKSINLEILITDKSDAMNELYRIIEEVGASKDVLLVSEPNSATYRHGSMTPGTLSSGIPVFRPRFGAWTFPMTITELV